MGAALTGTTRADRVSSPGPRAWAGFSTFLLGTAIALFALLVGLLLAVDPYATGRTGLFRTRALHDQLPFTAHASRVRDQRFDAAIFGNSHVQQLRPERLDRLTALTFVSLAMPATFPPDQLDVIRWFMANRAIPPRAIVIGMDAFWCLPEPAHARIFPVWLYAADFSTYLAGLVRFRSFEVGAARLRHLASGQGGIRPDGYWDYGPIQDGVGLGDREASHRRLAGRTEFPVNASGRFPALDRLEEAFSGLPRETAVLLLRPPVYRTALPEPGSAGAATAGACRDRMAAAAASRPRTAFLDLFGPGPRADDPDDYYDHDHYRDPMAVRIERDVAAALARLGAGEPTPR